MCVSIHGPQHGPSRLIQCVHPWAHPYDTAGLNGPRCGPSCLIRSVHPWAHPYDTAGYHPTPWRQAVVILVPKPKPDKSSPRSHHPISLLECPGKILEKLFARHISHDCGVHDLIPHNQFGSCPHLSTIHTGLALTHDIEKAWAKGHVALMLAFDIQGFFA